MVEEMAELGSTQRSGVQTESSGGLQSLKQNSVYRVVNFNQIN